jgi:hypothetical protein
MKSYHSQANDGTGEHLPGQEDQKLYALPHMWTLDQGQAQHREV